ncbi:MAG: protein TolA [Xanthomonadales bacterium]|nr:protein TolA [Xanthomonadales bacterium]
MRAENVERRDDTLLAFGGSLLLHGGLVLLVLVAMWLKPSVQPADVAGPVIEAVLVNFTAPPLPATAAKPRPVATKPQPVKPPRPVDPEPPKPAPAQDRIDQEKVRLAAEALEKAEREQEELRKQQQVDLDRQDQLTEMERERQKQLDDIRKLREEAERKRKIEEMKLAQLQDKQKQTDADKQRALEQQRMAEITAAEAQRAGTNGRDDSLKGQYIVAISQWADRNWRRPDTLREGFRCMLTVKQIPGGDVIEVNSSTCFGDPLVIRSVEAAVQREPLPYRGFESVFERVVTIPFCYPREICIQ